MAPVWMLRNLSSPHQWPVSVATAFIADAYAIPLGEKIEEVVLSALLDVIETDKLSAGGIDILWRDIGAGDAHEIL